MTKKIPASLFITGSILILVILFREWPLITAGMHALKILPEPETFTELYFNNHIALPATVPVQKKQSFSYTIHNLENKTMVYPVEVSLHTDDTKKVMDTKTISLPKNGYKTIAENFTIASPAARSEVVVSLKNLNQSIDFWITTDPLPTFTPTPVITETPTPENEHMHP